MKLIQTATEEFGPFHTVEVLSDRYRCNGDLDIQFDVIGDSQVVDAPDGYAPPLPPPTREELKAKRQEIVDAITVEVNGKVFDGDEISQERMARALKVADITGQTSCTWVLHDNSAVDVTKDELAQALALALQAQSAVWIIPE